ncbi:leucine-rich repeat domain-containing protein [Vallitalea pronyensis]|uniref:Leucine-rich repeat domain-containing protein n=1 Tax=Vallitalea pronyensis TaxID=1348613 RepID=A0A8J8MMZ3_9FIRM|nr:leucine-rich repeat domain-containing protein [Vallitalea pronyensis]QUI24228.1 leucine-rich repeat domain-containing protein [Vallitalea pronyensis]
MLKNETILKAVQQLLGKDNISKADILSIKALNLNNKQLMDISDLAVFENLVKLEIKQNAIIDFSPLSNLFQLEELDISNDPWNESPQRNKIKSLDFVQKLVNLKYVNFSHTALTTIDFVKYLPKLQRIEAMCNKISDLSPLKHCSDLRAMNFYSCRIWDIDVCRYLPKLEGISINENAVRDLSPLENCINLRVLNVHSNKLGDISCLKNLTQITYITLDQNSIGDISVLKNMPNINHLTLSLNPYIKDMSVLKELKKLSYAEVANLDLTPVQKHELQEDHPKCKFVWSY